MQFRSTGAQDMSSRGGGRYLYFPAGSGRWADDGPSPSLSRCRLYAQMFVVAFAAATLAACGQSSVVNNKSEWDSASRQISANYNRHAPSVTAAKPIPSATSKPAAKSSPYGVASFYKDDTETASGEKFDPNLLTAAHRTLPFGTRLRVTNVETGQSVTVRVNDRGPFVTGRSVDLSYSAAETIGMVERGITKVKLEVVRPTRASADDEDRSVKNKQPTQ
jgi:rare lipoprotein A